MMFRLLRGRAAAERRRRPNRMLRIEALESRVYLDGVPAFSSLPGAAHTIYLDFDGHTVTGTNWNSYYNQTTLVAQPYDIDGNPGTFSATELARIEEAWNRIAEDFSPFQVNVTTVDPGVEALRKSGSGDTQWGIRVIITNESTMVTDPAKRTGAGGIAYINSFTWSSDTPVWVFTTGGKSIAEAASHEVGHSLGLAHDGTSSSEYYSGHGSGTTGWAPIMGVGYYQNVTQWDNGTYTGTNNGGSTANYGRGPDDIAIITTYNGFGYRPDDHGNSASAATALAIAGTSASGSGIIERTSDVDVFSFSTDGGTVTLNINPVALGPNLDIKADLYDASGALVASSNPATALNASFSLSLAAGQYFLHIDGTGSANYSDYASLGQYAISGTIPGSSGTLPQLAIDDVTVVESAGAAVFTVSVTGTLTAPVTVNYSTANGTAVAPGDYAVATGQLVFNPGGPASQQVSVSIANDSVAEAAEQFYVNLYGASGATIADGQGVGTINDDDTSVTPGSLTISDVSNTEGHSPNGKKFNFTVRLAQAVTHTVTVQYATANGTAAAGADYVPTSGTLTFSPGQLSKTVSVTVIGDRVRENNETFFVVLSDPVGANLTRTQATGTIVNDDSGSFAAAPIVDLLWYFEGPAAGHHHAQGEAHEETEVHRFPRETMAIAAALDGTAAAHSSARARPWGLRTDDAPDAFALASGLVRRAPSLRAHDLALRSLWNDGDPAFKAAARHRPAPDGEIACELVDRVLERVFAEGPRAS